MDHHLPALDRRPRFPEPIAVHAPRGTRRALERAAEAEQLTVAQLLRRILDRAIKPTPAGSH